MFGLRVVKQNHLNELRAAGSAPLLPELNECEDDLVSCEADLDALQKEMDTLLLVR